MARMSTPETSSKDVASQRNTPNSIVWNELITPDPAAAVKFYGGLFGWTTETMPMPGMNYTMLKHGGETFGGIMSPKQPGTPPNWMHYVGVASLEETIAKAAALGAKVCMPPMEIGDTGRIAILQDPQGAFFGLHQMK